MKQLKNGLKKNLWLAVLPLGLTLSGANLSNNGGQLWAQDAATPAAPAAPATENKPTEFPQGILFPYSLLDYALNGNVDKAGHVNYLAIKNNEGLKLFVQAVASADLSKFPVLTRRETVTDKLGQESEKTSEDHSAELVFWINAYNGLVLHTIAQAYPISTPDNIPDFDTAKTHRVAGQDYSFAELRKKIAALDPRAFFALTDGTVGGPRLSQTAYRLVGLDTALNQDVGLFVSDPTNVQLLIINKEATLSPLLLEADEYFRTKAAGGKYAGIRRLLADYSIVGSNKRYFNTNSDTDFKFMRAQRALNRDQNLAPVTGE